MNLRYITCSDPKENVSYETMHDLQQLSSIVEFGIQAHPGPMSSHQPRNEWFTNILLQSQESFKPLNIALHINYEWCCDICKGKIPDIISQWLKIKNSFTQTNIIRRVQLNIGDGMYLSQLNPKATADIISKNSQFEFIFPYNDITKEFIEQLHLTNTQFTLLYDSSYGTGKSPDKWMPPIYKTHNHGYAGGLSPNNIKNNLEKISSVLPKNYITWIDAEGQLMKPGTRIFDTNSAKHYILNSLKFFNHR